MQKVLLTLGAVIALATASSAINLVTNAGFETGQLDPWRQTIDRGGPENWRITSDAFTGRYAATARGNKLIYQGFEAVKAKLIVSITFALKNSDATFNAYRFYYQDNTHQEFYVDMTNTQWNVYNVTSNLDRSKSLVGMGIWGVRGGDQFRTTIDDVTIVALRSRLSDEDINVVPEPASLLALGALAPLVRRRKR